MNGGRRIQTGAVVALLAGVMALAVGGASAGALGVELPDRVSAALGSAAGVLGWIRLLIMPLLVIPVLRARQD